MCLVRGSEETGCRVPGDLCRDVQGVSHDVGTTGRVGKDTQSINVYDKGYRFSERKGRQIENERTSRESRVRIVAKETFRCRGGRPCTRVL